MNFLDEMNSSMLSIASSLFGMLISKVYDFLFPDAFICYTRNICKKLPNVLVPIKTLSQLWEERYIDENGNHRHDCKHPFGYKQFKYAKQKNSLWHIKIDEKVVQQKTKIHIYQTISDRPHTDYHYFYVKIAYQNTDSPKIYAYRRLFHKDDEKKIIHTDITEDFNESCYGNILTGKFCFQSSIGEHIKGGEISKEQIGLIFGGDTGTYIIQEAFIDREHINITRWKWLYVFWRCYSSKPTFVKSSYNC